MPDRLSVHFGNYERCLFNDTVNVSGYTAPNDWMAVNCELQQTWKESRHALSWSLRGLTGETMKNLVEVGTRARFEPLASFLQCRHLNNNFRC